MRSERSLGTTVVMAGAGEVDEKKKKKPVPNFSEICPLFLWISKYIADKLDVRQFLQIIVHNRFPTRNLMA